MIEFFSKRKWLLLALYLFIEFFVMTNVPHAYSLIFTGAVIVGVGAYVYYINKNRPVEKNLDETEREK